jgi:hypothetical protein
MAVKGPLKDAIVSVYKIDTSAAGYKGQLIAEGVTDETAHLMLDIDSQYLTDNLYLFEYTLGTELNGNVPVTPTLRTIATSDNIQSGTAIYATPLTTLAVDYAINALATPASSANPASIADFIVALETATTRIKKLFGLGLIDDSINLFTSAPVLSLQTDQQKSLAHRTVIEVFAAVADQLMDRRADFDSRRKTKEVRAQLCKASMQRAGDQDVGCEHAPRGTRASVVVRCPEHADSPPQVSHELPKRHA